MIIAAKPGIPQPRTDLAVQTARVLNAYEVLNPEALSWSANILRVDFTNPDQQTHEHRGEAKEIIWNLRKNELRSRWPGYGFVIDLNEYEVAVPQRWQLAQPICKAEYRVSLSRTGTASFQDPDGRKIISGIIRDAIKKHFKDQTSLELGELWQDFDAFCQYPRNDFGQDHLMCKRFSVVPKYIAGSRLVLQTVITTATLDGRTVADYYETGTVAALAEMIALKREGRLTRKNRQTNVRVLHQPTEGAAGIRALDLDDVDVILRHAELPPDRQRELAQGTVRCRPYAHPTMDIPPWELRLILGSQITQEDHAETIIEPDDRAAWMRRIRDFVEGCDVHGKTLRLADQPINTETMDSLIVLPPAIRVRGHNGREMIIPGPEHLTERALQQRARARMDAIRERGFLQRRPINPALAWPNRLDLARGEHLGRHFNAILSDHGIEQTFALLRYRTAEELRATIEREAYDTVMVILPEGSRQPHSADDTHEQIKRRLDVPSQCLQYDNTLPSDLAALEWSQIKNSTDKRTRRIRQRYELCVINLLVKHHWFPFAPYEPFHYNVHVGLDVGGVHNTNAVACLGYGFRRPTEGLLFLPEEIQIETQQKEPIPTQSLLRGLIGLFETSHAELVAAGIQPDFSSVLFHRDGQLLGCGDLWNERDALIQLHDHVRQLGWIGPDAVWTVVEISKTAENWRLLRSMPGGVRNPVVGYAVFPFEDQNTALVATTGDPYLTQGTAQPLLVTISHIAGTAAPKIVVRDLVWQADLCFTKPDIGMALPWVLNVADTGALQLSKAYRLSGITA
jgi:hypothetical protein